MLCCCWFTANWTLHRVGGDRSTRLAGRRLNRKRATADDKRICARRKKMYRTVIKAGVIRHRAADFSARAFFIPVSGFLNSLKSLKISLHSSTPAPSPCSHRTQELDTEMPPSDSPATASTLTITISFLSVSISLLVPIRLSVLALSSSVPLLVLVSAILRISAPQKCQRDSLRVSAVSVNSFL